MPHATTRSVDEYEQALRFSYSFRFDDTNRFFLSGYVQHSNDSVTRIDSTDLTRDFEHASYRVQPSLRHEFGDRQTLRIGYYSKRRDYLETPGLNSLDWWLHGPQLDYDLELSAQADLSLHYDFRLQNYDSELASQANGDELATNPSEEHFMHIIGAQIAWRPARWLQAEIGYDFKHKDDRFSGFESYDAHDAKLSVTLASRRRLTLQSFAR